MKWHELPTECWLKGIAFESQWPLMSRVLCRAPATGVVPLREGVALVPRRTVDMQIFGTGLEEGQRCHLVHDSNCAAGRSAPSRSEQCQPG